MRLIACDLDGTILHPDNTISARTVDAFRAARDAGVEVVFVTGRPFRWLGPVQDAFGHLGTVICSNGALVYDLEAETVLDAKTVDGELVRDTRALILELEPGARFAAETTSSLYLEPGFVEPSEARLLDGVVPGAFPMDRLREEGVVKFLAKSREYTAEEFLEAVHPAIGHLVSVTHSAPNVALLEMARRDVNKAASLEVYAAALGLGAADVVAFGDMPNDVEMLAWAGRGYAMGSGHPLAKAAAHSVAETLENDGVARVIEGLLR
ncbi:HAD family hydrolase [Arthrobacter sp. KK5.5]|uniref:HAD family hydrolase n=1 Tax=Arthrobacter sp. KK5.5 TaxID=3373084 RepID=UPI003EE4A6E3